MSAKRDEDAIVVENLTKVYRGAGGTDPLRLLFRSLRGGRVALEDLSFAVPRGSALGVVGRNGSGKSTLLRILSGGLRASRGRFSIRGRVGALLDLTSGINPDFTGAENALLLGILAGETRQSVSQRMPAIREFSGLGDAFDLPVKSYSAGMVLRLGFSSAVLSDPDVLLIDEALAVGDAFFQQRCLRRMREFRAADKTIVLVSHDPSAIVSLCDRALWLEHGRIAKAGAPDAVVRHYLAARYRDNCSLEASLEDVEAGTRLAEGGWIEPAEKLESVGERFGDGRAQICGVAARDASGHPADVVAAGETVCVVITVLAHERLDAPLIGFTLRNRLGDVVSATNTEHEDATLPPLQPGERVTVGFTLRWPGFCSGPMSISPAVANGTIDAHLMCDWVENPLLLHTHNPRGLFGWYSLEDVSVLMSQGESPQAEGAGEPVSPPLVSAASPPEAATGRPPDSEPEPSRILGALERPSDPAIAPELVTSDRRLFVSGWVFSTGGEELVVRARIGERPACETRPEAFREDVAQAHPGVARAGRSGFGMLVPLPRGAGEARLVIEAATECRCEVMADVNLELPPFWERSERPEPSPPASTRGSTMGRRPPSRAAGARPRRLLFVSHNFNLEGAPRSLLEVATRLDRRRFSPQVAAPSEGPLQAVWEQYGVVTEVERFEPLGATIDDYQAAVRRTAALRSRHKPELLVANTLDSFWAVDVARELGIPSIWVVRESVDPLTYFYERLPVSVAERAAQAFARASRVLFVSRATERMFAVVLGEGKSVVIPNGLDLDLIDGIRARASPLQARKALGLPGNRPVVVCVGTTCQRKGQLVLIRALARLADRRPRPCCVFVGVRPGAYLSGMKALIEQLGLGKHVRLVPETGEPLPYYWAADLFVCPSFQESLPRVVLEGMGFSLPIVATSVHGIPELVRNQREAILFPAGDETKLAAALEQMLDDPERARALGRAGRRRLEGHFTLGQTVDRFQELLDEVLTEADEAALGVNC